MTVADDNLYAQLEAVERALIKQARTLGRYVLRSSVGHDGICPLFHIYTWNGDVNRLNGEPLWRGTARSRTGALADLEGQYPEAAVMRMVFETTGTASNWWGRLGAIGVYQAQFSNQRLPGMVLEDWWAAQLLPYLSPTFRTELEREVCNFLNFLKEEDNATLQMLVARQDG